MISALAKPPFLSLRAAGRHTFHRMGVGFKAQGFLFSWGLEFRRAHGSGFSAQNYGVGSKGVLEIQLFPCDGPSGTP